MKTQQGNLLIRNYALTANALPDLNICPGDFREDVNSDLIVIHFVRSNLADVNPRSSTHESMEYLAQYFECTSLSG